jgi:hypothetical protein
MIFAKGFINIENFNNQKYLENTLSFLGSDKAYLKFQHFFIHYVTTKS